MLPATVGRIAQLPRVVAVKEAVPHVSRVREILERVPGTFAVLSGDDASAREVVLAGARGRDFSDQQCRPARNGGYDCRGAARGCRRLADAGCRYGSVARDVFLETNPIPVKWALARMGLTGTGLRPAVDRTECAVPAGRGTGAAPGRSAELSEFEVELMLKGLRNVAVLAAAGAALSGCHSLRALTQSCPEDHGALHQGDQHSADQGARGH